MIGSSSAQGKEKVPGYEIREASAWEQTFDQEFQRWLNQYKLAGSKPSAEDIDAFFLSKTGENTFTVSCNLTQRQREEIALRHIGREFPDFYKRHRLR